MMDLETRIRNLRLAVDIGRDCAQRIEDRRAQRRPFDQVPGEHYTSADLARFRRRDYDAVKRAKIERARVRLLLDELAQLERQAARLDAWAADL